MQTCPTAATVVQIFACGTCGSVQPSKTALQMHDAVVHGEKSDIRLHVRETFCTICGLESHCRTMMMNHLDRSLVCRANTKNRHPAMTDAECEPFDTICREYRKSKKKLAPKSGSGKPCVRYHGPFLPVWNLDGSLVQTSNGHPTSDSAPWCRSSELSGGDGSLAIDGCPASLRAPCKHFCILCGK